MLRLTSLCFLALGSALIGAEPVTQKIDVLELMKAGEVEYHINPKADFHDPAKEVFQLNDGLLNISGRGYGYMVTKESYKDYHLVVEFKWGPKTWGKREDRTRDNGILVHAYGPHGAYGDTWMASIEAQIIEGGIGDILVLSPKLADGTELVTSVTAEIELDRDKEKRWKKGAPRQVVTKGRINWEKRDEDWVDKINFRGKNDPDSPVGEWNRLEVIAKGDTLQYFVNGLLVNEAFDCKPAEGRICIQTEGAQMIVRRYELHPLGQFTEKWNPIQASGGSDVSVRDGQTAALSPEESLKKIQLDGDYEAQLVAAEPLVMDPVEVTWDAEGRLYVADMRDYPLGPEPGEPALSRIQLLTDEDGDGRMDKAVTFADHVDHVQGLLPYNGGLIATTRTQILFLKDTDGDGKADINEPLIKGFNPRHSQLQVSAPRWGPDNKVYFNNGLDSKEIYPVVGSDPANVTRFNFRWDPKTGKIEPTSGYGQYGGAFDDYGRHFFCSNRNPLMFAVMPYEAVMRNPYAGIGQGHEDIAPAGAETRVYPLMITHTTADAHAGTNTACSGLGVYRGPLMPELKNNVFVPDPTGQLVTRYKVEPKGASLKATRVGDRTEFFRSSDEWCRPVNMTTGPDGAMYICDIYRRWIDHARFFPEEFVKNNDMRQGENEGRIWRIVKKGQKVAKVEPAPKDAGELKAWLKHENAWQRETAQRLLAEQGAAGGGETVVDASRKTFFDVLNKPDADAAADAAVIQARATAISESPEDAWMTRAVLSASTHSAGAVLDAVIRQGKVTQTYSAQRMETLRSLASAAAAAGHPDDFALALKGVQEQAGKLTWWKPALLQGLAEGLPKSGGKLGAKTLAAFVAKPPAGSEAAATEISALLTLVDEVMSDVKAPLDQRLAVMPLLAQRPWEKAEPVLRTLLKDGQPTELQTAALAVLKKYGADKASPLVYDLLPTAGPTIRRDLVTLLTSNAKTALALFKRMDQGEFSPALVDVETRWRYQRGTGEMRDLAVKLFGQASEDRAAVITSYMDSLHLKGNAAKGQQVFSMVCITCHKHGDLGVEVGPPLSDVKAKPPEALLSDILDPNRMVEARWCAYTVETNDGRLLSGLIVAESADNVTLKMMGGLSETIQRSQIKKMVSTDKSLMPPGLEAAITQEQMADLLAFLRGAP
ncbi:PVC-type heme-binding CxxCH protein [Prosthecobacter sp. SYSU 5D2]|uniref:PVC-type heme-binding CxxCH protein n=1 Tax=Prosthecobacter sp. SYSU 5D2 TaxID=3134134 RepID=UPI0031FEB676